MNFVVLANRHDYRKVIEELKYEFTSDIINKLELPEDEVNECLPNNFSDFDVNKKIKLRNLLGKFNVNIIDDKDGGIKIYVENEQIAEWKKCFIRIKQNPAALNISEKVFVEIHVDCSSVFEEK